ncbi:hypothetical protein AAC387_Pa12g1831 [Persea americana]
MLSRLLFFRSLKSSLSATGFSHSSTISTSLSQLKCLGFSSPPCIPIRTLEHSGIRSLSSRPSFQSRPAGDGRNARNPPPRGEFRAGTGGREKSLIEDEAELSDWVSDLKTDSFRLGLTSESDNDSDRDSRVRGRDRGRDRDSSSLSSSMRSRRGTGKEGFSPSKRFRESDSDEFPIQNRRWSRNSKGSVSRRRLDSDSELEEDEDFSPRQQRRQFGSQDGSSQLGKRGGRGSGLSHRSREGGGKPNRVGRESGIQALRISDIDDDEEDEDGDEKDLSGFEDSGEDDDVEVFKRASKSSESAMTEISRPTPKSSTEGSGSYLSQTRFDECSISPSSLKGIKAAGYERMTVVQEATLPIILKGKDVLARARTGTGKTVAFLLPAIEEVVKLPPPDRDQKRPPINVLIVCPTRELANQAAAEANTLLRYHPSIGVQAIMGGTRIAVEQKRMQANPCQLLVATPGRLRDHIENTPGFATRLMGVKVLVLDEADHLLDMGFRRDVEKIVAAVPKQRQTLLFSATVPEEVRQICHIALKRDHEFINTVEEGSEETHSQVRQMHLLAPLDKHFPVLYAILKEHISEDVDYKVLVFCTTAMVTRMVADLLSELSLNVREIHSRKPQSYRTRISDEFRKSKGLILVTSDVSARGVDYPDVTLVVQMGVPSDREQYIHRLGRTGRKGKEGKGILLLAPWEEFFLATLRDLPIVKASLPSIDPDANKKVERALSHVEMKNKEAAYQAWLGYYNSNKNVGRDKFRLVELANEFSRSMGLDNPPTIPKLVLGKMGLKNVPGLRAR